MSASRTLLIGGSGFLAPQAVDFAVDAYCKLAQRASELGARAICVTSGRRHPLLAKIDARLMDVFEPAFVRILQAAQSAGVNVWIENAPVGLLADAQSIANFVDRYPGVGVIYDVANGFAVGEDPAVGLMRLGSRIEAVHLSDAPRQIWRHDPIGSGDIDFSSSLAAAMSHTPKAPLLIEILSERPYEDLLKGRNALRSL